MIYDTLSNIGRYAAVIPNFTAIQAFLSGDLAVPFYDRLTLSFS